MSQTLPDLVVSPCPVRERLPAFYLRLHLMQSLQEGEGFSWHSVPLNDDHVVIYWKRYSSFDGETPVGELLRCESIPLDTSEVQFPENLTWLRERIRQIPDYGDAGTFEAIVEGTAVSVDVRVCNSGIYFRPRGRLEVPIDVRRCLPVDWAPEGMERWQGFEEDYFVHFIPKKPPKRQWKIWRRIARSVGFQLNVSSCGENSCKS
jgi:hypothetical protein